MVRRRRGAPALAASPAWAAESAQPSIDELLSICHRVLIVQDQAVTGVFARGARRQDIIDALAAA
mgnify:CR=1 FL=1